MTDQATYYGPNQLAEDVELAMVDLNRLLSVDVTEYSHHTVLLFGGIDTRQPVVAGLAVYLVGAIAGCIRHDMALRSSLFDEETLARDLHLDVVAVVGADSEISVREKTYERNPWIWEGISHLLLHLSVKNSDNHPPAPLIAKNSIHLNVKDHGLDIIALYGSNRYGITVGECKAYLERPADAIADAATMLEGVDKEYRDAEIRSMMSQFSLSSEEEAKLVGAFWHDERAYFPMVCCDQAASVDWDRDRIALTRLSPPPNRKFLVPAAIDSAGSFFDSVSDSMRRYALGLSA
jgi:hypothetical protein